MSKETLKKGLAENKDSRVGQRIYGWNNYLSRGHYFTVVETLTVNRIKYTIGRNEKDGYLYVLKSERGAVLLTFGTIWNKVAEFWNSDHEEKIRTFRNHIRIYNNIYQKKGESRGSYLEEDQEMEDKYIVDGDIIEDQEVTLINLLNGKSYEEIICKVLKTNEGTCVVHKPINVEGYARVKGVQVHFLERDDKGEQTLVECGDEIWQRCYDRYIKEKK